MDGEQQQQPRHYDLVAVSLCVVGMAAIELVAVLCACLGIRL